MTVPSASGKDVGEVESLIRDGDTVRATVGVGGVLGLGEHDVSIVLIDFRQTCDGLILPDLEQAQLEQMVAYEGEAEELPMDITVGGAPIASEPAITDPTAVPTADN